MLEFARFAAVHGVDPEVLFGRHPHRPNSLGSCETSLRSASSPSIRIRPALYKLDATQYSLPISAKPKEGHILARIAVSRSVFCVVDRRDL
jgi:hypothetical protein